MTPNARARFRGFPDWRDGAAYVALAALDRPGMAWEWLRRDPAYAAFHAGIDERREDDGGRIVAALPPALSARWGLHFRRGSRARRIRRPHPVVRRSRPGGRGGAGVSGRRLQRCL